MISLLQVERLNKQWQVSYRNLGHMAICLQKVRIRVPRQLNPPLDGMTTAQHPLPKDHLLAWQCMPPLAMRQQRHLHSPSLTLTLVPIAIAPTMDITMDHTFQSLRKLKNRHQILGKGDNYLVLQL